MSVASIRISLQWPPAEPFEDTDTLVLTSNDSHFVDLRVLKNPSLENANFPLDWVLTGREKVVSEDPFKIEFQHEINTHVEGNTGGSYDVGTFEDVDHQDRREYGEMLNLQTGKVEKYVEIWRSIDPITSNSQKYISKSGENGDDVPVIALKVDDDAYLGTIVRIGNWLQGAILNLSTKEVSVTRVFLKNEEPLQEFAFGTESSKIPIDGLGENLESNGLKWKVVEKNF